MVPPFFSPVRRRLRFSWLKTFLLGSLLSLILCSFWGAGTEASAHPDGGVVAGVSQPLQDNLEGILTHQTHLLRLEQGLRSDDEPGDTLRLLLTEWSLAEILQLLCGLLLVPGIAYLRFSFRDRFSRDDRRRRVRPHLLYRFLQRHRALPLMA